MGQRAIVELCGATILFIAVGTAFTIARGHLFGDLFIVLAAPLPAAMITVIARLETRPRRNATTARSNNWT